MFLYTLCPGCQAGYDLTDLLSGKKIRCKSCGQAFTVTATPRPYHLPALAPFPRPQLPAPASGFSARPVEASPPAATPSRVRAIAKPGRALDRLPRPARQPSTLANAGGWFGRGGISVLVIVVIIGIRLCAGLAARTANPPRPIVNPQPQMQQPFQHPKINFPKFQEGIVVPDFPKFNNGRVSPKRADNRKQPPQAADDPRFQGIQPRNTPNQQPTAGTMPPGKN